MTPSIKKKILTREEILTAATPSTENDRRCNECNIVFQNLGAKNMHLLRTHGISDKEIAKEGNSGSVETSPIIIDSFQCTDCEKSFTSKKLLIQHFQKMHIPKNIKCNFCEKVFGLERDLRYHQSNRCKRKRAADSSSFDTVSKKKYVPKTIAEVLQKLPFELPPHLKIVDTSKMIETSTQTDTVVQDAELQVYIEQPYYNPAQEQQPQYSTQTEPIYINQYQQTYSTIPCPNYSDWRNSETQTQNATNTIGTTTTQYWPQENEYSTISESAGTQTWYPSQNTQMIDSFSMTDELNYIQ
uniref:C2H2-type domain-containing protein n=2 Tax=Panagrolaimus sp. PS1159 TaxID=55785 RepID=A0AC35GS13_9BILA